MVQQQQQYQQYYNVNYEEENNNNNTLQNHQESSWYGNDCDQDFLNKRRCDPLSRVSETYFGQDGSKVQVADEQQFFNTQEPKIDLMDFTVGGQMWFILTQKIN